jgi:hypothetical protein
MLCLIINTVGFGAFLYGIHIKVIYLNQGQITLHCRGKKARFNRGKEQRSMEEI